LWVDYAFVEELNSSVVDEFQEALEYFILEHLDIFLLDPRKDLLEEVGGPSDSNGN